MLFPISTVKATGKTLYAFPDNPGVSTYSLANWTSHRALMAEGVSPNTGRYSASVESSKSNLWRLFEGASQPSGWDQAIEVFVLPESTRGSGQYAIVINVKSSGVPVRGALVTARISGEVRAYGETDASGNCPLLLDAATYQLSVSATGFSSIAADSLVVTADATVLKTVSAVSVAPPSTGNLCTVTFVVVDGEGEPVSGAVVTAKIKDANDTIDGGMVGTETQTATCDSNGIASIVMIQRGSFTRGGVYRVKVKDMAQSLVIYDNDVYVPNLSSCNGEDLIDATETC